MNGLFSFIFASAFVSLILVIFPSAKSFAVEAVKPPMPYYRKAALDAPKLIPVDQVKTFVNGLGSFVNPTDKTATLRGRVPNACVPFLTLQNANPGAEGGAIPFALMGTSRAIDCLKTNLKQCAKVDSDQCSDFEKLSKDSKYGNRWHPVVQLENADPSKTKVVLAKSAIILNDKSMKLEATADCCDVDALSGSATQVGDEQPLKKEGIKALGEMAAAVNPEAEKARKEIAERAAKRREKDVDDEEKSDDPEAKRNAARDPTLTRVPTDKDMELATAKNMEEYYKQYYQGLMQAQMFQMNIQMQNLQFQLKTAQMATQNTTQSTSLTNSWMANYAPMQTLGGATNFMSLPSFAGGSTPTLTLPALGNSALTGTFGR